MLLGRAPGWASDVVVDDAAFLMAQNPIVTTERRVSNTAHTNHVREGGRFITSAFNTLFYVKPGKVTWRIPAQVTGRRLIEMQLRQSAYGAEGRDMVQGYRVFIDGEPRKLEWTEFAASLVGGAQFAKVRTPVLNLDGKEHTLTIQTVQDWCAVYPPFMLFFP